MNSSHSALLFAGDMSQIHGTYLVCGLKTDANVDHNHVESRRLQDDCPLHLSRMTLLRKDLVIPQI